MAMKAVKVAAVAEIYLQGFYSGKVRIARVDIFDMLFEVSGHLFIPCNPYPLDTSRNCTKIQRLPHFMNDCALY